MKSGAIIDDVHARPCVASIFTQSKGQKSCRQFCDDADDQEASIEFSDGM